MAGKSLSPFLFFFSREKHRALWAAVGTTAGGFRGIIPSILRYALASDVVVGRLPLRPALTLLPHGDRRRNLFLCPWSYGLEEHPGEPIFQERSSFPCSSRVHGFPYDLGYYALVIGPWMENRGNTNGLPWLGGLRTSMWKGEINQANRSFSPDHRTEPIEAPCGSCSRL